MGAPTSVNCGVAARADGEASNFGDHLRRLRTTAGLTQEELAERAGLTAAGVSALERGHRRRPYPHTVRAIASALALTDAERPTLFVSRGAHLRTVEPVPVGALVRQHRAGAGLSQQELA